MTLAAACWLAGCGGNNGAGTGTDGNDDAEDAAATNGDNGSAMVSAPSDDQSASRPTPDLSPTRSASRDRASDDRERMTTEDIVVKVEPERLELGEIAAFDEKSGTATLVNTGDKPMTVRDVNSTCGCTVANVPRGKTLEPGERVDFDVTMNGGRNAGQTLSKVVTIWVDGQPPVKLTVVGNVVTYVAVEPEHYDAERTDTNEIVVKSLDGTPFRILSMNPPIVTEFSEEPQTEHVVVIDDWEQFIEFGRQQYTFRVDHPKVTQAEGRIIGRLAREIVMARRDRASGGGARASAPSEPRRPSTIGAAVRMDDLDAVEEFVTSNPHTLTETDRHGSTALMIAASEGKMEILAYLLEAGADPNAGNRAGKTALMLAAEKKQREAVRALIAGGADINARDDLGGSAVLWTAALGDAAMLSELILAGGDSNISDGIGMTPLMWASGYGDADRVQVLLENDADIAARDEAGMTALMHAARTGSPESVGKLLDAGASVSQTDSGGQTALTIAVANGRTESIVDNVRLLLEAGADPTAADGNGQSAIDIANGRDDAIGRAIAQVLSESVEASAS